MTNNDRLWWFVTMVALMFVLFGVFRNPNELVSSIVVCGSIVVSYVAVLLVEHRRDHTLR